LDCNDSIESHCNNPYLILGGVNSFSSCQQAKFNELCI
jgi:hypothetical protein